LDYTEQEEEEQENSGNDVGLDAENMENTDLDTTPKKEEEGEAAVSLPSSPPPPPPPQQQQQQQPQQGSEYLEDKYHMIVSTDKSIYAQWMILVCYKQYLKMKEKYPDGPLGGFTRLLHSNTTDYFMDKIPTIRVDTLPAEDLLVQDWVTHNYPPLNRPYAFYQFTRDHLHKIPERYIFMSEPDHIIMEPPPLPSQRDRPVTSSFWYMGPHYYPDIVAHFNPKNVSMEHFYPTGNAPGVMDRHQLAAISENWYDLTKTLLKTKEFRDKLGWVLEMYSFVFAAATTLDEPIIFDIRDNLLTHPPQESLHVNGKLANIFHFTYAGYMNATNQCTWEETGTQKILGGWEWDKRHFGLTFPPGNFLPPPSLDPTCDSMRLLINCINEASENNPHWELFVGKDDPYVWIQQERAMQDSGVPPPEAIRLSSEELLDLYVEHYLGVANEFSVSLLTLREYAQKCTSIFVLGQGSCTVLWPLMQGLHAGTTPTTNTTTTKSIIASEVNFHPNVDEVRKVATGLGIDYTFHQQPSLNFEVESEYEMLFIDTWHVAGQLKRELQKYGLGQPSLAYIILHGPLLDGSNAEKESVQGVGWDVIAHAQEHGMTEEEVKQGLGPAIDEFISAHPEWMVEKKIDDGSGLTVLAKRQ